MILKITLKIEKSCHCFIRPRAAKSLSLDNEQYLRHNSIVGSCGSENPSFKNNALTCLKKKRGLNERINADSKRKSKRQRNTRESES